MSPRPSPLKSATPTTDQLVPMLPTPAVEPMAAPFMNHIAMLPLWSSHNMSALPSPLKSRCPTIDQVLGTLLTPPVEETVAPFISQNATSPLVSRHAMSLLPSSLKSCDTRADLGGRR